jgi:hypothetical protein
MAIIISGQKRKQRVLIRIKNNRTIKFKKRYADLTYLEFTSSEWILDQTHTPQWQ